MSHWVNEYVECRRNIGGDRIKVYMWVQYRVGGEEGGGKQTFLCNVWVVKE
jgi:hypothetical protein